MFYEPDPMPDPAANPSRAEAWLEPPYAKAHTDQRFRDVQGKAPCVELADDVDVHWHSEVGWQ